MKNRIFTFGCSFVEYSWPTWADMILYENEGRNVGLCGTGVESMLYRFIDADRAFSFTKDDIIIMIFTTPIRWDLIVNMQWCMYGQTITSDLIKYEDKLFCIDGLMYKSYYSMKIIDDLIKSKGLKAIYGSVNNPYENVGNYFEILNISDQTRDLIRYVSDNVKIDLKDFHTQLYEKTPGWETTKIYSNGQCDYHPRPKDHFMWVKNVLQPIIDTPLNFSSHDIELIENEIDRINDVDDMYMIGKRFPKFFEKRTYGYIYAK